MSTQHTEFYLVFISDSGVLVTKEFISTLNRLPWPVPVPGQSPIGIDPSQVPNLTLPVPGLLGTYGILFKAYVLSPVVLGLSTLFWVPGEVFLSQGSF